MSQIINWILSIIKSSHGRTIWFFDNWLWCLLGLIVLTLII